MGNSKLMQDKSSAENKIKTLEEQITVNEDNISKVRENSGQIVAQPEESKGNHRAQNSSWPLAIFSAIFYSGPPKF